MWPDRAVYRFDSDSLTRYFEEYKGESYLTCSSVTVSCTSRNIPYLHLCHHVSLTPQALRTILPSLCILTSAIYPILLPIKIPTQVPTDWPTVGTMPHRTYSTVFILLNPPSLVSHKPSSIEADSSIHVPLVINLSMHACYAQQIPRSTHKIIVGVIGVW